MKHNAIVSKLLLHPYALQSIKNQTIKPVKKKGNSSYIKALNQLRVKSVS